MYFYDNSTQIGFIEVTFMFNIFSVCFAFFVTTQWSSCYASTTGEQREKINAICRKASRIATVGYTEEADNLARETTIDILDSFEVTEPSQVFDLFDAFLKMELFQAFNTQYGLTKTHDHRIVYDFLSSLNKARVVSHQEKTHLTTFTALSLAAQEFFWNPKSTVDDLRRRVKCELRYGLFKKAGDPLDVSALIYLEGAELHQIIDTTITEDARARLNSLLEQFLAGSLGNTYAEILTGLQQEQARNAYAPLDLSSIPRHAEFGINRVVQAARYISSGAGNQCGFNSLFIPTENSVSASGAGTAREKVTRSLEDDIDDPLIKMLYVYNSDYCESVKIKEICDSYLEKLSSDPENPQRNEAIRKIIEIKQKLTAQENMQQEENARKKTQGLERLHQNLQLLKKQLLEALEEFTHKCAEAETMEKWRGTNEFNKLGDCIAALKIAQIEFNEFFNPPLLNNFVLGEFFAHLCNLIGKSALAKQVELAYSGYSDLCSLIHTDSEEHMKAYTIEHIIPFLEEIGAVEISGDKLTQIAKIMADRRGIHELLECAEPYVQHWAIRQNLNIVVFSTAQRGMQPPLECLVRASDEKFADSVTPYPTAYQIPNISTVILTSPTAKTLLLTKTPIHYDKLIPADDLITIARQMRQAELMKDLSEFLSFKLDLSGLKFSGLDFSGLDFSG